MAKWSFSGKHGIRADRVLEALGIDGRPFTARDFLGVWIDMHGTRECPLVNQVSDYFKIRCKHVVLIKRGNQKGVRGSGKGHLYGVDELWLDERLGDRIKYICAKHRYICQLEINPCPDCLKEGLLI